MRIAAHWEPAWRERANFMIGAKIDDAAGDAVREEQLWTRRVAPNEFELCCIPYFVYDLALGDVVSTDENHLFTDLVRSSGRSVFRVIFDKGSSQSLSKSVVARLTEFGALVEWYSAHYISVDAEEVGAASAVSSWLLELESQRIIQYETGLLKPRPRIQPR